MPENYPHSKPKSLLWIDLAIKLNKFLIFVSVLYFSYFFLFTTKTGDLIVNKVSTALETSRSFIYHNVQVFDSGTRLENNIYEREYNPDTLSKLTPEETAALGVVKLPYGFQVQNEYKGIKFVRSPRKSFTDIQIKLLKYFIDNSPAQLLTPGPDAIIISESDEIEYKDYHVLNPSTLAFSSGTYMFLTNVSFEGTNTSLKTIDEALQTFLHELTHIAQFNYELEYLTQEKIYEMTLDEDDWTDLIKDSELTRSFREFTEWKFNDISQEYFLDNPDNVKTTKYGKTSIYEDMAETVAGVTTSQLQYFSDNRIKWAVSFLKEDYDQLSFSMFPYNELLIPVRQEKPRLNFSKEEEFIRSYDITDREYFMVEEQNAIQALGEYFIKVLPTRGYIGNLDYSVDANGVEKYKGEFKNEVRTLYIELESFDRARGYAIKPSGTIVNIINGYDFTRYE